MIEAKDDVIIEGTVSGLKYDFYNIVNALLDNGVYEDAGEIAVEVGRICTLRSLSPEARLKMLFQYEINAMPSKELMHEIGGELN